VDHCGSTTSEEYLSVSESRRLALHKAAKATLGDEEGDTLMELSPPANTDIATMQALEHTEERLRGDITATRKDLEHTEDRLSAKISADITATRKDLEVLRHELNAQIERTTNRTIRWTIGAVLALNGGTAGLLTLMLG